MVITEKYFHEEPVSNVIGPQLGPCFEQCGVRITIALPSRQDETLSCHLFDKSGKKAGEPLYSNALHAKFRTFLFEFNSLNSGEKYYYKFLDSAGNEINLEGGLDYQDCWFFAPEFNDDDKFVLLSCNNPFHSKKDGDDRFGMWKRLFEVTEQDQTIKLLIQGGDQVYHDDIEADSLQKLKEHEPNLEAVQNNVIKNYQHYYSNLNYRRILARIPSVAMLDDHDITDGWGGRNASFDKNEIRPEWQHYFDITYDAFKAYQSLKNPTVRLYDGVETTYLDFGKNRVYLLDLRKEKNIKNKEFPLISAEHATSLLESIDTVPDRLENVLILSPVVPVRINPTEEETLNFISELLYQIRGAAEIKMRSATNKYQWVWQSIFWASSRFGVADLTDDLKDGLSSSLNRKFLVSILERLATLVSVNNKQAYILSGDIHTGGISEIFIEHEKETICIPQVVSSPIGYAPMKKIAKDKTTEEKDYKIILNNSDTEPVNTTITARNIFYKSDRNFAILTLSDTIQGSRVAFYFENLQRPIVSPATFSNN